MGAWWEREPLDGLPWLELKDTDRWFVDDEPVNQCDLPVPDLRRTMSRTTARLLAGGTLAVLVLGLAVAVTSSAHTVKPAPAAAAEIIAPAPRAEVPPPRPATLERPRQSRHKKGPHR